MDRTESLLIEIRDLLRQLLELVRAANPRAAEAVKSRWEGLFQPIRGAFDEVDRWAPRG